MLRGADDGLISLSEFSGILVALRGKLDIALLSTAWANIESKLGGSSARRMWLEGPLLTVYIMCVSTSIVDPLLNLTNRNPSTIISVVADQLLKQL